MEQTIEARVLNLFSQEYGRTIHMADGAKISGQSFADRN